MSQFEIVVQLLPCFDTQFTVKVLNFYLLQKLGKNHKTFLATKTDLNFMPYSRIWSVELTNHSACSN